MQTLVIETPEGIRLENVLAGPGSRSAALLIDFALYLGVWFLFVVGAVTLAEFGLESPGRFLAGALIGGGVLFWIAAQAVLPLFLDGATPGKRMLGLQVVGQDGRRARPLQFVLRALFLPVEMLVVGIAAMLLSERSQRIGDLVAGTVVLRRPAATGEIEPFPGQSWSRQPAHETPLVPAHGAHLEREDLEFLRGLLARTDLAVAARRQLYVAAARHYRERLELPEVADARVFLRELFLFARERAERGGLAGSSVVTSGASAATPEAPASARGDRGSAPVAPRPRR